MRLILRLILAFVVCAIAGSTFDTARADPYRYCAVMGGGQEGGMVSCYFMTLQQCQATISGIGGFCRENLFYDGRPEGSAVAPAPQPRKPKGS